MSAVLRRRPGDQPLPVVHDDGRPDIQSLVVADLTARRQLGIDRYGTALQAGNGRDALWDAYEESLDLATYLRQVIEERLLKEGRVSGPVNLGGYRWDPIHITEPADEAMHGEFVYGYAPGTDERDGPRRPHRRRPRPTMSGTALADLIAGVLAQR